MQHVLEVDGAGISARTHAALDGRRRDDHVPVDLAISMSARTAKIVGAANRQPDPSFQS